MKHSVWSYAPAAGCLCAARCLVVAVVYGVCSFGGQTLQAEPVPGDVYREYIFTQTYGDAGGAIRVGGKKGISYPDRGSDFDYVNAWLAFPHTIDLEHAIRAEVVVEKILSHNGTHGLAIQWNDSDWLVVPSPDRIALPSEDYYHHTGIEVPIPLGVLLGSSENRFRLKVAPEQHWGWPQHLVYGVHLRVYYDASVKEHASVNISSIQSGETLGRSVDLAVGIRNAPRRINRVDYLGKYTDVNWPGDGNYYRWQYFYYRGKLIHHIGSSVTRPFDIVWDTSWLPDQDEPMQLSARVIDDAGLIVMTPAVDDLALKRPGLHVELCKPYDVPSNWVTRQAAFEEKVNIRGDLTKAIAARLCWSSWSPGYMNGLFVNETQILDREGPRYRYFDHQVDIPDLSLLKPGTNTIGTGKTPLHDGKMVHGMEVNWPGIQLLIQYRSAE